MSAKFAAIFDRSVLRHANDTFALCLRTLTIPIDHCSVKAAFLSSIPHVLAPHLFRLPRLHQENKIVSISNSGSSSRTLTSSAKAAGLRLTAVWLLCWLHQTASGQMKVR